MRQQLTLLLARILVVGGAGLAFGWWQQSIAAGLALFLTVWALAAMRPGGGP